MPIIVSGHLVPPPAAGPATTIAAGPDYQPLAKV